MNEISRKFPEFARSVKKGLGGEDARHTRMFCAPNAKVLTEEKILFTPKNPVRDEPS